MNALIAHCGESLSGIGGVRRPGIVHRLDKDTSGLLVVAKNDAAHRCARRAIRRARADRGARPGVRRPCLGRAQSPHRRRRCSPHRDVRNSRRSRRSPAPAVGAPSRTTRVRERFGGIASLADLPPGDRAAPTRSASTWRISATRSSATGLWSGILTKAEKLPVELKAAVSKRFAGRRCMPGCSASPTRERRAFLQFETELARRHGRSRRTVPQTSRLAQAGSFRSRKNDVIICTNSAWRARVCRPLRGPGRAQEG